MDIIHSQRIAYRLGHRLYIGAVCPKGHAPFRLAKNSECLQCRRDGKRKLLRGNPDRRREADRRDKLGWPIWLQRAWPALCSICGNSAHGKNLHADHDHKTKKPRGFLCASCNRGLGQFQDSPELLRKAVEYLADPPARMWL